MKMTRPKLRRQFVIVLLLCFIVLLPHGNAHAFSFSLPTNQIASVAENTGGFFCKNGGFLFSLFGLCKGVSDQQSVGSGTPSAPKPKSEPDDENATPPSMAAAAQPQTQPPTTTTRVIRETPTYVTNEYITNPTTIIRETPDRGGGNHIDTSNFVSRSLFDAQVDATHNSLSDSVSGLSDNLSEEVSTDLLTVTGNGTLSGTLDITGALSTGAYLSAPYLAITDATATSTLSGALTVGTTTSRAALTLDGALYLAPISPTQTTSRLYNQNGSLYWAGNIIAGASVGTWDASGGNVYRLTGNVGIGNSNPAARLEVTGTASSSDAVIGNTLTLNSITSGMLFSDASGNVTASSTLSTSQIADAYLRNTGDAATGDYNFSSGTLFVDDSAGRIGIGTTTPGAKLTVIGKGTFGSIGNEGSINLVSNSGNTWGVGNFGGSSIFRIRSGSNDWLTVNPGGLVGIRDDAADAFLEVSADGNLGTDLFMLSSNDDADGDRFIVKNNGNVGIGTTNPSSRLQVESAANQLTYGSANISNQGITLINAQNAGSRPYGIQFGFITDKTFAGIYGIGGTSHTNTTGDIAIALRDNPSDSMFTERVRITRAGSIGIGTTSPSSKLSVTGTMSVDGLTGNTGAGSLCLTSNNEVVFNSGSDACLPSLRETKRDIETLDLNALDMVSALESVSFAYNMGDGRTRYGFIAEDVADIDALLATYNADGELSGIDDRSMIAVVVKAMQEMYQR